MRKPGSGSYLSQYTPQDMDRAVRAVRERKVRSLRQAARDFGVPHATLTRRVADSCNNRKKHDGQMFLGEVLEGAIATVCRQLGEWKIPLTLMELRLLVKNYLDIGKVDSAFRENMPGRDWARNFLRRNKLSMRLVSKIKPTRAKLSKSDMEEYFENLRVSLEGIDPSNIYNFDETCMTDDPSRKKCIVRRGARRNERVTPFSKQGFSVMFCGSATGVYLPPMVVYRAKNVYDQWQAGGVQGTVYGATDSGWFNMEMFEKWFFQVYLPHVRDAQGRKALIGDNLGSHFSPKVVSACIEHDIRFVTLLPNSTHICQPLDVAVFRPLKILWRAALDAWRCESRLTGTIPKETFPVLLGRVCKQLVPANLVAGFKASGISPLDSSQVISRLAGGNSVAGREDPRDIGGAGMVDILNEAVVSLLRGYLGISEDPPAKRKGRGKKVTPGKALTSTVNQKNVIVWFCMDCSDGYDGTDSRWVVCDRCDHAFHLEHSGIQYFTRDYYDLPLESMAR